MYRQIFSRGLVESVNRYRNLSSFLRLHMAVVKSVTSQEWELLHNTKSCMLRWNLSTDSSVHLSRNCSYSGLGIHSALRWGAETTCECVTPKLQLRMYVCRFQNVVRHLDSTASYLPTGLHLGFFRSWPSLYLPPSFSSVFLVLSFVSASTSILFWVIVFLPFFGHGRTM